MPYGNYCYFFQNSTNETWFSARLSCIQFGGDLLSIEDKSEQAFVNSNEAHFLKNVEYWIGLTDQELEGKFVWSDIKSFSSSVFNSWAANKPDTGISASAADCVFALNGKWADGNCAATRYYVCKRKKGWYAF